MKLSVFLAVLLCAFLGFFSMAPAADEEQGTLGEEFAQDARTTIDIGVSSIMKEMHSPRQLEETINLFIRSWREWEESELFVLKNDTDIDAYGNLYSLQVMCRTLLLAAKDWNRVAPGDRSERLLERAQWLYEQSRLLAEPVAEILKRQGYNSLLRLRVEVMLRELPYVEVLYERSRFLAAG